MVGILAMTRIGADNDSTMMEWRGWLVAIPIGSAHHIVNDTIIVQTLRLMRVPRMKLQSSREMD